MDTKNLAAEFAVVEPEVLYFGTPVAVISTLNPDGTTNLAAMSSFWALRDRFVIGIGSTGQSGMNLTRTGECVLNFPSPEEWQFVERLAPTTGRETLTDYHRNAGIVFAPDKFAVSGFTPLPSEIVAPLRAAECPIHVEARMVDRHTAPDVPGLAYFQVQRLRIHVRKNMLDRERRIDIDAWSPLFYVFRHYFGKGLRVGRSFRAKY
ncbi:MAG: flavin reductase family protein [Rhizomicrobium sp.]